MDCPNCGAYNASNSVRCRRCNHILSTGDDDSSSSDDSWGPASGPEERWEEHFRQDPSSSQEQEEGSSEDSPDPWTTPDSEPFQPSDWDIVRGSGSDPGSSSQGPASSIPTGGTSDGAGGSVPNYLWPSIAATLCCCAPLGIPAIIYASRVDAFVAGGDRASAEEASNKAKMWALAAVGVSILFWIAIFCTGGFGAGDF